MVRSLVEVCGYDQRLTRRAKEALHAAAKDIRRAGYSVADVHLAARDWDLDWVAMTPHALAKHMPRLVDGTGESVELAGDDMGLEAGVSELEGSGA